MGKTYKCLNILYTLFVKEAAKKVIFAEIFLAKLNKFVHYYESKGVGWYCLIPKVFFTTSLTFNISHCINYKKNMGNFANIYVLNVLNEKINSL